MKRTACVVAVGLLAAATGVETAQAQTTQSISVKGSAAGEPSVEGGVTVYRGPGSGIADARVGLEELAPSDVEIVGGEVIWFVNRADGRLVGCNLRNTFTVGVRAITCTRRSLPRGARRAPIR
ncbi:MAG: hypothetical protein ACE5Q3_10580 [Alphaproteobacteria bacterium]